MQPPRVTWADVSAEKVMDAASCLLRQMQVAVEQTTTLGSERDMWVPSILIVVPEQLERA
jgi:hypothetical protein